MKMQHPEEMIEEHLNRLGLFDAGKQAASQ